MARRQSSLFRSGQRLATGLSLAGFLIASIGLPVPRRVVKDDTPFPCRDRACGCSTAAQSWGHCCCFTAAERVAWARERGVEVPSYASPEILAVAQGAPSAASGPANCGHCGNPEKQYCAANRSPAAAPGADDACGHCGQRGHAAPATLTDGVRFVSGPMALACRGESIWSSGLTALPAPPHVRYRFDWRLAGRISLDAIPSQTVVQQPPTPPPRTTAPLC